MDNKLLSLLVSIVDGARELVNSPPQYEQGRHTLYQFTESDLAPLREDIRQLDSLTSDLSSSVEENKS